MIKHFKQELSYGCGLYALANALQDESYITPRRLNDSIGGNNFHQLNTWIQQDRKEFTLSPIYVNRVYPGPLPTPFKLVPIGDENLVAPMVIAVKMGNIEHAVALHIYHDGAIRVIDSLKDKVVFTTWEEINSIYICILDIWAFGASDDKERWMMLSHDNSITTKEQKLDNGEYSPSFSPKEFEILLDGIPKISETEKEDRSEIYRSILNRKIE